MRPATSAKPAWLMLEDGHCWQGTAFGAPVERFGELVFNTAMTGYQEILTDPSYRGQMVLMTYPEIGNYGINTDDVESKTVHVAGFVVRRLSRSVSSWRASGSLAHWLRDHQVPGIEGIDTRAVTRHVREKGAMKCGITTRLDDAAAFLTRVQQSLALDQQDLVGQVTTPAVYRLPGNGDAVPLINRLVVLDFGTKQNILRCLQAVVREIVVMPAHATLEQVLAEQPNVVFLSNGPGDPRALPAAIRLAQQLIERRIPTFGICLGHQLLCLALGLPVEKMTFGHHGGNHPVMDVELGLNLITSQNHGYCVTRDGLAARQDDLALTHVNLNDGSVEGFRHKHLPVAAVQFHPEAAPGPHDARYLFERFLTTLCPPPSPHAATAPPTTPPEPDPAAVRDWDSERLPVLSQL